MKCHHPSRSLWALWLTQCKVGWKTIWEVDGPFWSAPLWYVVKEWMLLETCKHVVILMQQAFDAALSALKANPPFGLKHTHATERLITGSWAHTSATTWLYPPPDWRAGLSTKWINFLSHIGAARWLDRTLGQREEWWHSNSDEVFQPVHSILEKPQLKSSTRSLLATEFLSMFDFNIILVNALLQAGLVSDFKS